LQELDLTGPEVVLGRSPECQITIEDPLVSRQHARILIDEHGARVVDLGSRNGVRINGHLIRGESPLHHNDRVRLGTQDLVFLVIGEGSTRSTRATGFMLHCANCERPFPSESAACPHCGAERRVDAESNTYETITGVHGEGQGSWTFQLLAEVIERALSTNRSTEAERTMQRAAREIEERVRLGLRLDSQHLTTVSVFALRLSSLKAQPEWAEWALTLHREQAIMPASAVLDQMEQLSPQLLDALRPLLSGFHLWWNASRAASAAEPERLLSMRVAALAREL
jgi:hypothetical protein